MKVWHPIIAILIFSSIVLLFTSWGKGGLMYDMRHLPNGSDSYNANINLSKFGGYDSRGQVGAISGNVIENSTDEETGLLQDQEQRVIGKLVSIGRDVLATFPAVYRLIQNAGTDLGFPPFLFGGLITIIGIWAAIKAIEWVFGR